MAKLIIDNVEYELPDGSSIAWVCEQAGIPFQCNNGVCGSCQIKILEGAENLNQPYPEETAMGLNQERRLACLCAINQGTVKITY